MHWHCDVLHCRKFVTVTLVLTASVVWWSEFLAANQEVLGLISSGTKFSA
jgi:hypothetical protein